MLCVSFVTKASVNAALSEHLRASCFGPSQSRNTPVYCNRPKKMMTGVVQPKMIRNNRRNNACGKTVHGRQKTVTTSDGRICQSVKSPVIVSKPGSKENDTTIASFI